MSYLVIQLKMLRVFGESIGQAQEKISKSPRQQVSCVVKRVCCNKAPLYSPFSFVLYNAVKVHIFATEILESFWFDELRIH